MKLADPKQAKDFEMSVSDTVEAAHGLENKNPWEMVSTEVGELQRQHKVMKNERDGLAKVLLECKQWHFDSSRSVDVCQLCSNYSRMNENPTHSFQCPFEIAKRILEQ